MTDDTLTVDGAQVRWYAAGDADAPVTVMWHHGTPNIGAPPAPLLDAARDLGVRFVSFDRPGYGGSDAAGPRAVADLVPVIRAVADASGAERLAHLAHSGGGPSALAVAHADPERTPAVALVASITPPSGLGLKWFTGMAGAGTAELKAALKGGDALREHLESADFDPEIFTERDHRILEGDWAWLGEMAAAGVETGIDGAVYDNLSFVGPWGFDVADVEVPVLVVQGTDDRIVPAQHGRWLASTLPHAEHWEREGEGHLSVLSSGRDILAWLTARARER